MKLFRGREKQPVTNLKIQEYEDAKADKARVAREIATLYADVRSIFNQIQNIKSTVEVNSLLELMIIYKELKFPTTTPKFPRVPTEPSEPLELQYLLEESSMTSWKSGLALTLTRLFSEKKYREKISFEEQKRQLIASEAEQVKDQFLLEIESYVESLSTFESTSLDELQTMKSELSAIFGRLNTLKTVIESEYSIFGPELITAESNELQTLFTIPASVLFEIQNKRKGVHIKIGAATDEEYENKDSAIPQVILKVACPIKGGSISYSFHVVGDIPLSRNLQQNIELAIGAIGQGASVKVLNDIYDQTSTIDADFSVAAEEIKNMGIIEIPTDFATELNIAEDIAINLYLRTKGVINVSPTDVLTALHKVCETGSNASVKLKEILERGAERAEDNINWGIGGAQINADVIQDMSIYLDEGMKKIVLLLRSQALRYPWQFVTAVLAVCEGRADLLSDIQKGLISSTGLYLQLEAPKKTGAKGIEALLGSGGEHDDPGAKMELSPSGAGTMSMIDPQNKSYHTAQVVPLRDATQILIQRSFQKGLVNRKSMQRREVALEKVGTLLTDIRGKKIELVAEELQVVYDSLVEAIKQFQAAAPGLKREVVAGIVEVMKERASRLSVEIPEFAALNEALDEVVEGEYDEVEE